MKFLFLVLMLSACSSQSVIERKRSIASIKESEEFGVSFEEMFSQKDFYKNFLAETDFYARMYYRTDSYVDEFDKMLDKAVKAAESGDSPSPLRSDAYQNIVTMWNLSIQQREKIAYMYNRMQAFTHSPLENPVKRALASYSIKQFEQRLKNADSGDRIAFSSLAQTILEDSKGFAWEKATNASIGFLGETSFQGSEKKIIRERARLEILQGADLEDLVKREKSKIIYEGMREPQSVKIAPGTGASGNINGNSFPLNTWALTYDDGPSTEYTPKVLENLEAHNVKATFFWLAQNVLAFPKIVNAAKEKGMALENHSYSHANLPKISADKLKKEIITSTQVETPIYGERPTFFRCPYGSGVSVLRVRELIASQGMVHVFWNVDSLDWQDKNPASILARVKKQMLLEKKGVVLFHDIHPQSVEASRMMLEWTDKLKSEGTPIRWATIPEIVDELNKTSENK